MSWLFSQALGEEYSRATCSDGEQWLQLNVTPTQHKFWRNDKTMEPSDLSRFGLTCAVLTEDRGADLLTWFQAASRAKTSALQERAPALTESDPACGPTWRGSLAKFDPVSHTWRTAQPSLLGDSEECSVTWPRSGMTVAGQCWELPTLVPPIRGTGSGLWLQTPIAAMARNTMRSPEFARGRAPSPQEFVKQWPTPTSSLGTKGGLVTPDKAREGGTLIEALSARTFATPTARDWRSGKASQATMDRNSRPLSEQIGGLLNPTWVEWLMGWPIGWTDLKPLATGKSRSAQRQPGECLQAD